MHAYFGLMSVLGLLIMAGAFFRASLTMFLLLWGATYLMQSTYYNNHYSLIVLLCVLLLGTPAHAAASWGAPSASSWRTFLIEPW